MGLPSACLQSVHEGSATGTLLEYYLSGVADQGVQRGILGMLSVKALAHTVPALSHEGFLLPRGVPSLSHAVPEVGGRGLTVLTSLT